MFDEESIVDAVRQHPDKAAQALAQIRAGEPSLKLSAEGLDAAADVLGDDRAEFWVATITQKQHLQTFGHALMRLGVLDSDQQLTIDGSVFPIEGLSQFLARMPSFRCKVRVNGDIKGSGILVGPSSALTAWHVTAVAAPNKEQLPVPIIEVELADHRRIGAVALPEHASRCGDDEYLGRAPRADDEVKDLHDIVLLRLKQPVGIHLKFAELAPPVHELRPSASVMLVSYPNGNFDGLEVAKIRRMKPKMVARWSYDVMAAQAGSSGGGCFNTAFRLAGVHQGRSNLGGRLVPLRRFDSLVRAAIEDDVAPEYLWSLDGTPDSSLVVGRDAFFSGYQATLRTTRARGVWVRRVDLKNDVSGLPFSFDLLSALASRSVSTRVIRISFDIFVHDLAAEVARRATEAGIPVEAPVARHGVGETQTQPEAVVADRCRILAQQLDVHARRLDITLWIFFDHPAVAFGDDARWALTAFVDQAIRLNSLRVALAGFEAMQMPCAQFENRFEAEGDGAPGLMLEFLMHVLRSDVNNLIQAAAQDLNRPVSVERLGEWAGEALNGLTQVNNQYDSGQRRVIGERLQPLLKSLRDTELQP
jgi:hypothetical protein